MTARTRLLAITVAASLLSSPTFAQNELPPQTLFTNVHVWDGTSGICPGFRGKCEVA